MKNLGFALLVASFTGATTADTIYLCKAYAGGTFWTNGSCSAQGASIDRIASVPNGMPFDQQVKLGQAQQAAATAAVQPQSQGSYVAANPQQGTKAVCTALSDQVTHFDAMARQPQSGAMQDWISAERKKVRDKQFALRC